MLFSETCENHILAVYVQMWLELKCVPTESSRCRSHQNEHVVSFQSLCLLCMRAGCEEEEEGRGGAGWSRSCWTHHWLPAPGCWWGARAGVAVGPWAPGSSGSGQVRGGRRSSGAEWCWETVVELFTPPSTPPSPTFTCDQVTAAPSMLFRSRGWMEKREGKKKGAKDNSHAGPVRWRTETGNEPLRKRKYYTTKTARSQASFTEISWKIFLVFFCFFNVTTQS